MGRLAAAHAEEDVMLTVLTGLVTVEVFSDIQGRTKESLNILD